MNKKREACPERPENMATQAEFARRIGISRQRAHQYKIKGYLVMRDWRDVGKYIDTDETIKRIASINKKNQSLKWKNLPS